MLYYYLIINRLLLLLLTDTLIRHTLALGINCRGSLICETMGHRGSVSQLEGIMAVGLDKSCTYPNGQHIACAAIGHGSKGVCAFLQGTAAGLKGDQILLLIADLAAHNCDSCGSVPIGYPESNDPSDGILTVNYVVNTANPCPNGICFTCSPRKDVVTA